jgi:hypothetical protein
MLKKCFAAEGSKIYKHIYHGIGFTHNGGEVRFFCERGMKGPYSDKSDETIEYLTSIVSDLVCRDIAFTYYPPDYIKNGKIYDKNFIAPWWALEPNYVRATIENANPYYVEQSTPEGIDRGANSNKELVRKRYLDYIPCIEFQDQTMIGAEQRNRCAPASFAH